MSLLHRRMDQYLLFSSCMFLKIDCSCLVHPIDIHIQYDHLLLCRYGDQLQGNTNTLSLDCNQVYYKCNPTLISL